LGKQLNSILTSLDGIMRVAPNVQRNQSQMVLAIDVHANRMLMLHWLGYIFKISCGGLMLFCLAHL